MNTRQRVALAIMIWGLFGMTVATSGILVLSFTIVALVSMVLFIWDD